MQTRQMTGKSHKTAVQASKERSRPDEEKGDFEGSYGDEVEGDLSDQQSQKKRVIKMWSETEDTLLIRFANKFKKKWDLVAKNLRGRNASQCAQRYRRIFPGRIRSHWTKEEDSIVLENMNTLGKNWGAIAANLIGRTGKQVRERYLNCLDPQINWTSFSQEEDDLIWDHYHAHGPKWSDIAKLLKGRPENMIKNRYYAHLRRIRSEPDAVLPRAGRSKKKAESAKRGKSKLKKKLALIQKRKHRAAKQAETGQPGSAASGDERQMSLVGHGEEDGENSLKIKLSRSDLDSQKLTEKSPFLKLIS